MDKVKEELAKQTQGVKEDFDEKLMNLSDNVDGLSRAVNKIYSDIESLGLKLNQRINESIKKTQNQVDTCVLTLSSSQEKLRKTLFELQSQTEKLFDEINNIRESMTPSSPTLVYQPSLHSTESPKSSAIKPKKSTRPGEKQENHLQSTEFLNQLKDELKLMQTDFKQLKTELEVSISKNEVKSQDTMHKLSEFVESSVGQMRIEVSDSLLELREKLKWLPINLKEIKGMSPSDARIFIIEARLRSEENMRIDQYNKMIGMLDSLRVDLKNSTANLANTSMLPNLQYSGISSQTPDIMNKDTYREPSKSFRNSPTPERIKFQLPRNVKISMSVDINKSKKRKEESLKFDNFIQ